MSESATLADLRKFDHYDFESFIADLWTRQGWNTEVVQRSRDKGIDVIATKDSPVPRKELIQAKRYAEGNKVGSRAIQQYASLRQQEDDADSVVVVTTSSFTTDARDRAADLNVKLIDGESLIKLIREASAEDLIEIYTDESAEATRGDPESTSQVEAAETVRGSTTASASGLGAVESVGGSTKWAIDHIDELLQVTVVLYVTYKIADLLIFDDALPDLLLGLL